MSVADCKENVAVLLTLLVKLRGLDTPTKDDQLQLQ